MSYMMNQINLGWWSCYISLYYETIGTTMTENMATVLINLARNAKVNKDEIDEVIRYYDGDLQEEVENFLKRLKEFVE